MCRGLAIWLVPVSLAFVELVLIVIPQSVLDLDTSEHKDFSRCDCTIANLQSEADNEELLDAEVAGLRSLGVLTVVTRDSQMLSRPPLLTRLGIGRRWAE